jgi:hypothetical protein
MPSYRVGGDTHRLCKYPNVLLTPSFTPSGRFPQQGQTLSGSNPSRPRSVGRETRSGAPGTRLEPRAKTGPFPPGTGAPVPGGGYTQELRRKQRMIPPKPEGQFWQAADGDGGDARVLTRERRPRIGAPARARAHSRPRRRRRRGVGAAAGAGGRDAGRGRCGMRNWRVEEPSAAHAGSLVMLGPGEGAGDE